MKAHYFLLFFIISSCSFNGSFGGLVSCYKKTNSANPDLISAVSDNVNLCELSISDTPKVYSINGLRLRDCLNDYNKSIVYIWQPNCSGSFCVSLELVQLFCNTNEIELFIVADYYDNKKMNIVYDIDHPIFGIDVKYYKSNFTSKYRRKFVNDLTNIKNVENNMFFLFENNTLVDYNYSIDSLNLKKVN